MKPAKRAQAHPDNTTLPNVPIVGEPWNFQRVETVLRLPASIAYNAELSFAARILWGIIRGLSWRDGRCFAKNETLCERLGCQERQLRNLCAELRRFGLLRESRRQNSSPVRELLWHGSFSADTFGAENPGPDDAENEPDLEPVLSVSERQKIAEPTAISCRADGNPLPLHLNSMRGEVLEGNTSSSYGRPVENSPISHDDDDLGNALKKLGCDGPGIRRAVKHCPAGFDWRSCLEYAEFRVRTAEGKIASPAAFFIACVMGAVEPPDSFETSAKRRARVAREQEAEAERAAAQLRDDQQVACLIDDWRRNDPGRYAAMQRVASDFSAPGRDDWGHWLLAAAREMLSAEGNAPQCIGEAKQEGEAAHEVRHAPNFRQLWITGEAVE